MGAACSCSCFIWRSRAAVNEKQRALGVGVRGPTPLPSHWCLSKDKYWLWTVLITSLNWAILLFPVGSPWKIYAGFECEAAEQGWAWRAINHRRYIIHWKHVKRTRQDGPDHWKQHFHRSVHEEDGPRRALALGRFCSDRLTKKKKKLAVIFTDSDCFVRHGSGMLGHRFWWISADSTEVLDLPGTLLLCYSIDNCS